MRLYNHTYKNSLFLAYFVKCGSNKYNASPAINKGLHLNPVTTLRKPEREKPTVIDTNTKIFYVVK